MIVDFCTYTGPWPLYPLPYSDPAGLVRLLDRCQIGAAFVSALDGLFSLNAYESNDRLAESVAQYRARLLPVGTLNPSLPTWRRDLADGIERYRLAGFRLHPAYHGYSLADPRAAAAARAVGGSGLPLFVAAFVDEERFQHPALRVPPVLVADMAALLAAAPETTFVLNNLAPDQAATLLEQDALPLENAWIDVNAMDKEGDWLAGLVRRFGPGRLVFGSQAPFLYPEAALTLVLAGGLDEVNSGAILAQNWQRSPVLKRAVLEPGEPMPGSLANRPIPSG